MKRLQIIFAILMVCLLLMAGCRGKTVAVSTTQTPVTPVEVNPAPEVSAPEADNLPLEVVEPVDGAVVNTSRVTVSGRTAPDAVVSINGNVPDVNGQGEFTEQINLDFGPNIIEIIASDFYGNEKGVVLTVFYVTDLPLTVHEPLNEAVLTAKSVTVKGVTCPDAVVSVNDLMVQVDGSGNFSSPVVLEPGPNFIEVVASDFYDNTVTEVITVICLPENDNVS